MTMTKRELVIRVASKLGMTQSDVAKIVDETFESIARNLGEGKRWELRDFGVFEVKTRASRIGRNPRTGDQVPVAARRVVTFRPGKQMREGVSGRAVSTPAVPTPEPVAMKAPPIEAAEPPASVQLPQAVNPGDQS